MIPVLLGAARAPLGGHLWHIVALGAWPPIFGLVVLTERVRARRAVSLHGEPADCQLVGREARPIVEPPAQLEGKTGTMWLQAMAVASVCAALIHTAVMPTHFEQSVWYGLFFLVAAISQLCFAAIVIIRPRQNVVLAGIAGSVFVIVLWLLTRTVGVPIGPDNGATEPFGLLDVLATVAELATAMLGTFALRSWSARPAWHWSRWGIAMRFAAPACIAGAVAASFLGSRS